MTCYSIKFTFGFFLIRYSNAYLFRDWQSAHMLPKKCHVSTVMQFAFSVYKKSTMHSVIKEL